MIRCPRCQHENPAGQKFCGECGARNGPDPNEVRVRRRAKPAKGTIRPTTKKAPVRDLEQRLAEALEQQTASSEILRVIASSPTNMQLVLDTVAESAARLCEAVDAVIFRRDGDQLRAVAHYGLIPIGTVREFTLSLHRGTLPGRVVLEGRTIQVPNLQAEAAEFPVGSELARQLGFCTTLNVPLMREGVAIGTIALRRTEVRLFTAQQIALLQTFADQAVIAIENVRLFNETKEALEQQTATAEILRVISSSPTDVAPVFDAILRSAVMLCRAAFGAIYRYDGDAVEFAGSHNLPEEQVAEFRRQFPTRPHRGLLAMRAIMEQAVVQVADLEEDREFRNQRLTRAAGIRSMIAIPLRREGVTIGAFAVARAEVGCFADGLIELLTTFADQAVIAIENVRLFTELQEKNRALTEAHGQVSQALERQTATAEILHVISRAQMDVQPVFEAIADSAMRLFGAFGVYVFCSDGELIHLAAARGGLPGSSDASIAQWRVPRRPQADGLVFRVLRTRRMQQILDVETDTTVPPELCEDARRRGWRSSVQVPMLRGDDVLGTIAVSRAEPGGLSPAEIALLQTFADQAVIAVENVRLLTELQARTAQLTRSVDQLTALGEVGQAVSSSLDLETVLTTIVSRAVQLSGLDGGVIFEYDEAAEEFTRRAATAGEAPALAEVRRGARIRKGEGVLGRTAVTLAPVQVEDIAVEGAYEGRLREPLLDAGVRALLAVPMLREGRLLGGLVVNRRQPGAFPAETVDLLRTFATQSALAIQNARLFQEIEAKGRELQAASQHKSDFLANMSHELRTPLNAIIGYSEMLQEEAQDRHQDSFVPDLEKINAAAKHQLSLINDILDLSKVEAGRMELEVTEFDLLGAIDNALTLVRERATRRGIALGSATDGGVGSIRADERKVKQVLLNLLSNALKFTPEGGRIEVCATLTEGTIEVSVSDTGVGIAPEDHEAVFEEFRQVGTADKKVEGTGLGLALCRRFVELHGGRIWVTSQAGRGSTFTFTLPV